MAYLNYPKDEHSMKWWSSRSKVNRCLAIIAFSYDKENALRNLRRHGGYAFIFRQYHAWNNLGCYVNAQGTNQMANVPFHDETVLWYDAMPFTENETCWTPIGGALAFVTNLPSTTQIGQTYRVTWKGGEAPFSVVEFKGSTGGTPVVSSNSYYDFVTTGKTAGNYHIEVTDKNGVKITSTTTALSATAPVLAWNAHPAVGTIGTDLLFSWTGGTAPFNVVVLEADGVSEHDNLSNATSPYTLHTTTQEAGNWKVTVTDSKAASISQTVAMAAKPPINITLTEAQVRPTFGGVQGSGTATKHAPIANVTIGNPVPATGLSNGNTVTTVVTANTGYTVNNKASDTFTSTVSGLTGVAVTGVTISPKTVTGKVGDPDVTFTATVAPANAGNQNVSWSTSDPNVMDVDFMGVGVFKGTGTCTVTVTTQDGNKTDTCAVTVSASSIPVASVSLNKTSTTGVAGTTEQLTATVLPANATDKTVAWSSNNANATVSPTGLVTFVTAGSSVITVTTTDGSKTATCNVTVTAADTFYVGYRPQVNPPNSQPSDIPPFHIVSEGHQTLSLLSNGANFGVTASKYKSGTVIAESGGTVGGTFTNSNPSVAVVTKTGPNDYSLTIDPVAVGTTNLVYTCADGVSTGLLEIIVSAPSVPVTSVTVSPTTKTLEIGQTQQLTPTVLPANATNKNVSYASSAAGIASVNASGLITAVAAGTATITVTTQDGGKTSTCVVTVNAAAIPATDITTASGLYGLIGAKNIPMPYTIVPANANVPIVFEFVDPAAAATRGITLDATGHMTIPEVQADGTTPQTDANISVKVTANNPTGVSDVTDNSAYLVYAKSDWTISGSNPGNISVGTGKEVPFDVFTGGKYHYTIGSDPTIHYVASYADWVVVPDTGDDTKFSVAVDPVTKRATVTGKAVGTGHIISTANYGGVMSNSDSTSINIIA